MNADEDIYSLCFELSIIPDSTGLTYHLSDFNHHWVSYDVGGSTSLEEALTWQDAPTAQAILASFREQSLTATKG